MNQRNSVKEIFREGSAYRFFLLSILITGLSYGLYKGILDNFLAEVVMMGEMDRGITEFFRELPGIALFGGWIWQTLGIETLFIASAVLGLCNSAYAATIQTQKH